MHLLRRVHTSIHTALRGFVAVVGLILATSATAQSQSAVDFNLPAQPLETSLRQIANAQKLQMIYTRPDLSGVKAPVPKRGRSQVFSLELIDFLMYYIQFTE